jgi:hypothetical protein
MLAVTAPLIAALAVALLAPDHARADHAYGYYAGTTAQGGIDGRSLTSPGRDTIFACDGGSLATAFDRPWIDDSTQVIDLAAKPTVDGAVGWPSAFDVSLADGTRTLDGNGLPDHPTGAFPIQPGDNAYAYDPNPNRIAAQDLLETLPPNPEVGDPECLGMGAIGVALSGAVFYNALDAEHRDAVANEIFDDCEGHPQQQGQYHYHHGSPCFDLGASDEHSPLIGYALDGFGMYGPRGQGGAYVTNDELDVCHGHTGPTPDDPGGVYHYHVNEDFPYTLGCYRGTPDDADPKLKLEGSTSQRLGSSVKAKVSCDEDCEVVLRGTLKAAGVGKLGKTGRATESLEAGEKRTIKARIAAAKRRRAKRALSDGHATKASLKAKATDPSGNGTIAKRTVKLKP